MGIAGRFARNGAQAEAFVGAVVGCLQAAIVEHQRLALAAFEIEFAVVGTLDRIGHDLLDAIVGYVKSFDQCGTHRKAPYFEFVRQI